ncbi:MAG: hypothetical protein RLZZ28_1582 [Bacteroidota bacterium]
MNTQYVYESFFTNSLNALIIGTETGSIIKANKAACKMFGYSEEELKKLGREVIIDTNDQLFQSMHEERLRTGTARGVLKGIRKNGEKFPVKISSVTQQNEQGEQWVSIMAIDVSDQIAQETKLSLLLEDSRRMHQQEEDNRILLENVLNSITDGFFIVDREWKVLFWNKAAEIILQKTEEAIVGRNVWDVFPDLNNLREHVDYKTVFEKNQSVRFRDYFPNYKIWAEVSVYPSEKNISVYIKDVTEIKGLRTLEKLEREVLEMNARTNSDLSQILDFYLTEIEDFHKGMHCSVLRLKNNKLYKWSAPNIPHEFSNAVDGMAIGEGVGSCGTAAFRKEKVVVADIANDPLWKNSTSLTEKYGFKACWSFPLLDSRNEVMGTFAIYYNRVKTPSPEEENTLERARNLLTILLENKLAVEAMNTSVQNYDLVSKATNDAIWDWNMATDEVIRTGNGMKVLFGYDWEDMVGNINFWDEKIHPEDLPGVKKSMKDAMDNPAQMYWEREYRFKRKNGQYAFVFDKGYIIRESGGNAVRLIGATRDISERKHSEEMLLELNNRLKQRADELTASNVELEKFAYIASHDMQEPLRMITSFLQLFKKKYADQIDETAEQYIHFAVDGAERMKKLIMDLLEYSRVGSNKDDLAEIDTNELLQEVLKIFSARIEELHASISIGHLPKMKANRTQIFQLFQNLIGNALKYHSGEDVQISVNVQEEATQYVFSVKDNGIGIKPIFFEKIFILFQRLHHKNEYSGTGIGLAICKKIVDRHGGKIWLESEPGKGSCFYFSINKAVEPSMVSGFIDNSILD